MSWFDDLEAQWQPKPIEQPWTPTYEPQQYVSEPNGSGGMARQPINIFYFATQETAAHLLAKYFPSGQIVLLPFEGSGGPDIATASCRVIVSAQGIAFNAGILASIWTRNWINPDVAHKLTLDAIAARNPRPL